MLSTNSSDSLLLPLCSELKRKTRLFSEVCKVRSCYDKIPSSIKIG